MSVGYVVVGACGYQKLIASIARRAIRLPGLMMKEGEAALEPADDFGIALLPRALRSEREQSREIVPFGQLFEDHVRKR